MADDSQDDSCGCRNVGNNRWYLSPSPSPGDLWTPLPPGLRSTDFPLVRRESGRASPLAGAGPVAGAPGPPAGVVPAGLGERGPTLTSTPALSVRRQGVCRVPGAGWLGSGLGSGLGHRWPGDGRFGPSGWSLVRWRVEVGRGVVGLFLVGVWKKSQIRPGAGQGLF